MKTKIEWTEYSWNPITGCSEISPGCANCYAKRFAERLKSMGKPRYKEGFKVQLHSDQLVVPKRWKKNKIVFVNSMSDLFHEEVPDAYIKQVFDIMNTCRQHVFQILTKRSDRLQTLAQELNWTENIWMGVSIEDAQHIYRLRDLLKTNAKVKFISFEPLLGPIPNISIEGIDWVIVGGESGPNARPMNKEWVVSLRDKCCLSKVPFFFKQWGGVNKKAAGRCLEGKIWNQMPEINNTIREKR
jgi:protein gp37